MSIWCSSNMVKCQVEYALVTTEAMFHRELRAIHVPREQWPRLPPNGAGAATHTFTPNKPGAPDKLIVFMPKRSDRTAAEIVMICAHEATHIFQACREEIGEHHPSHEFEAYSIGNITQELFERYCEQTRPKRKARK